MIILGIVLVPFFLISLYVVFKFNWGEEGKDERGQKIVNRSFMLSSPIMPVGWLLIEVYLELNDVSYELYRDLMWILVLLTFIVQGITISVYRKKI